MFSLHGEAGLMERLRTALIRMRGHVLPCYGGLFYGPPDPSALLPNFLLRFDSAAKLQSGFPGNGQLLGLARGRGYVPYVWIIIIKEDSFTIAQLLYSVFLYI